MADNASLLPLGLFDVNDKVDAQTGDPVTIQNTMFSGEANKIFAALDALQFFFADINTVNVPDKERFGQILNQVLGNFAPATRLVRTVSGVEYVLELMSSGGWRYSRAGVTLFEVSPTGAVSGQVLTSAPDNITNDKTRLVGQPVSSLVVADNGWSFVRDGVTVRRIDQTGALVPAEAGGGGTGLGWKAPLLGDNPPRVAATQADIPSIPARTTTVLRINFDTGGFVEGGFVRLVQNADATISTILAGRLKTSDCRPVAIGGSGFLPNSSGTSEPSRTFYASSNYLKSAVFVHDNNNLSAEVSGVVSLFRSGFEQSKHTPDVLWGYFTGSDQGVFETDGGKVQCNKAYLEPGLTGGTDLVIELFNASPTGASSAISGHNWFITY